MYVVIRPVAMCSLTEQSNPGELKIYFITFSVSKNLFSKMNEMQFLTTSSLWALLKTVLPFSIMETNKEKEEYTSVKCLQEPQRIPQIS